MSTQGMLEGVEFATITGFHYVKGEGARAVLEDGTVLTMTGTEHEDRRRGEFGIDSRVASRYSYGDMFFYEAVGRVSFETEFAHPEATISRQGRMVEDGGDE